MAVLFLTEQYMRLSLFIRDFRP